jgi:hypothetical protein
LKTSHLCLAHTPQYYVTVAPGVDIALMATLCILFDEAKNEEGGVDILSVARRVF